MDTLNAVSGESWLLKAIKFIKLFEPELDELVIANEIENTLPPVAT